VNHGSHNLVISAVPWDIFGTLTVREECSRRLLVVRALQWLRWVAHVTGRKFRDLAYCIRVERGEAGNRLHLHVLIRVSASSVSYFIVPKGWICQAHVKWGYGRTMFRRVYESDPVVAYVLKETAGADSYELGKTEKGPDLVVSKGLWKHARASLKRATGSTGRMNRSGLYTGGVPSVCVRARESMVCVSE